MLRTGISSANRRNAGGKQTRRRKGLEEREARRGNKSAKAARGGCVTAANPEQHKPGTAERHKVRGGQSKTSSEGEGYMFREPSGTHRGPGGEAGRKKV